jgi:hypothetical protein
VVTMENLIDASDEGGIYALVDLSRYPVFVAEKWDWESITGHFAQHADAIALWQYGDDASWFCRIGLQLGGLVPAGMRSAQTAIESTSGQLHIASYDALTSAAVEVDGTLPGRGEDGWSFAVPVGRYRLTIVQIGDPDEEPVSGQPSVVLHLEADPSATPVGAIFFDEEPGPA